jgi:hypothetical protein
LHAAPSLEHRPCPPEPLLTALASRHLWPSPCSLQIYTTGGNFYLPAEALAASPSRADGIDAATEAELRRYCCDVVAESVVLLRLPQVVAVTAQVLVQRFYCKRSLKKFDVKVGAAPKLVARSAQHPPALALQLVACGNLSARMSDPLCVSGC